MADFGAWMSRKRSTVSRYFKLLAVVRILINAYRRVFDADPTHTPHLPDKGAIVASFNFSIEAIGETTGIQGLSMVLNNTRDAITRDNLVRESPIFALMLGVIHSLLLEVHLMLMTVNQAKRRKR